MLPVYMNMSYELGLDWEIAMFEFRYSKNNLGKNCLAFFTYCNIIYWEPKKVSELEYISGKFKWLCLKWGTFVFKIFTAKIRLM